MKNLYAILLVTLVLACGCTSKAKANARAREAFEAGQRQALSNMSEARRVNIRVLGPVRHPEILWEPGLTLARVIAAAGYTEPRDPAFIRISRQREQFNVSASDLLNGQDWPLEPGDTVQLQP